MQPGSRSRDRLRLCRSGPIIVFFGLEQHGSSTAARALDVYIT